jgi:hypothetical protein
VDFVVCILAVIEKSGHISTCRIGPFPCETTNACGNAIVRRLACSVASVGSYGTDPS